jgi:hypothetical protein
MPNISSIVKNVRNIMRQDRGVSGDAQRLEQIGWMNPELEQLARILDRFKLISERSALKLLLSLPISGNQRLSAVTG